MLPAREWWSIMEAYGARIWPAQMVFFIVAVVLIAWVFVKPDRVSNTLVKLYLILAFAWIGIVFFLILARGVSGKGNYLFGPLFIAVSMLLAVDLHGQRMQFCLPEVPWQRYSTLVLMLAVFCYPLFGMVLGHRFPRLITAGTFPCPTTALGLLLLTTALPRVDKVAYILLLLWAIPFPPFIQIPKYGVYEDAIMFVVGIYSLIMLVTHWKERSVPNQRMEATS